MAKLGDFDTPSSRISLFAEELKEIKKEGNEITEELIDLLSATYADMQTYWLPEKEKGVQYGFVYFMRDDDKAFKIIDAGGNVRDICKKLDKNGIDYILTQDVIDDSYPISKKED